MLGGADPVRVDRLHVLRIGLASPLEEEALGGGLARRDRGGVDRRRLAVVQAGGLRHDRDHRRREATQILLGPSSEMSISFSGPIGAEPGRRRLQVGDRLAGRPREGVGLGQSEARA